jgi:hypothetical protein
MKSALLLVAGALAASVAGCSRSDITVRTAAEPGATLTALHTFYVLTPPARSANAAPLATDDPMLENSITNNALRSDLAQALQSRGYALAARQDAEFDVAYYAGTREKFDTTYWGPTFDPGWRYHYWGRQSWAWPYAGLGYVGGPYRGALAMNVTTYTEGQVIVDVVDARSRQLLWRGQGAEPVSTNPAQYARDMQKVVTAIIAKFPHATAAAVASRP